MQVKKDRESRIYPKEFHIIRDKDNIFAFEIESVNLIKLNEFELNFLNHLKKKPASIQELNERLSDGNAVKAEETVEELLSANLLDHKPVKGISKVEIEDFEKDYLEKLKNNDLKQICLNVTHKCNLNCDYCYGEDGSYGGSAIHMNRETAEQAVNFLMEASGDSKDCRISFFGGEPLLNFDLVKHIVQYSREQASKLNKRMVFGITTNGTLLNEHNSDFLIKEKIDVTLSFDGPKEMQDKNRTFKSIKEQSSYDLIYPKILKFIEKAEKNKNFYGFRATITGPGLINIRGLRDFFDNFKTNKIYYDTAEYKNDISPGGLSITKDGLKIYRKEIKELADEFKIDKSKSRINSIFSGPLKSLQKRSKKKSYCISPGCFYIGVSAEGDLFPCHRFVGYKDTKLGNVWDGYDKDKWLEKYSQVNIFKSKRCSACWIRFFCGGMCPATNHFLGGDLVLSETVEPEPVHCAIKKIVFEEAVLLYCDIAGI
jgi:uncharacterized protein